MPDPTQPVPPASPAPVPPTVPPPAAPEHSALLRNGVHAGVFFLIAIPLGMLADPRNGASDGRYWSAGIMFAIAIFNLLILPHLDTGKRIARPGEGITTGLWLYPLAVSFCFILFPAYAVIGAWAAMAAGDAMAAYVGRSLPQLKLPWNTKKSWAGMIAFALAALPVCYLALYVVPCRLFMVEKTGLPELPFVWTLAVLAAVSGAILESLDTEVDDNLRVPLGVGAILWVSAMFLSWATRGLPKETHVQPEKFLDALLVNAILGVAVIALRFADIPGALLGVVLGVTVYFFSHWQGYLLFLLFVVVGSGLSKIGLKTKESRGAAEARDGKRGISNVAANLLVPGVCCLLYPMYRGHGAFLMAYAGALAAAFADTASSEIGTLSPNQPRLITTLLPVPHGTNGGVSLLGFAASVLACVVLSVVAAQVDFYSIVFHMNQPSTLTIRIYSGAVLVAAGLLGSLMDSFLGATIEDRWPGIGKGVVNFACTLTGALVGALGFCILQ